MFQRRLRGIRKLRKKKEVVNERRTKKERELRERKKEREIERVIESENER